MARVKPVLEYATNIAIIIASILVAISFARNHWTSHEETQEKAVGTVLQPVSGYQWRDHQKTLLLGLQIGCRFCEASMPFYQHLSELHAAKELDADLLVVMPNDILSATGELHAHGVNLPCACGHPLSSVYVTQTPTLLLVNAQGRVEREWVGQLSSSAEKQVISALEK